MKKITLFAVATLAISFASCKKDRTCTCTTTPVSQTVNGVAQTNIGSASTTVTKYAKVTKKGTDCKSGESNYTGSYTFNNTVYNIVQVDKLDCKLD